MTIPERSEGSVALQVPRCAQESVLIVDDVVTTGMTMTRLAAALGCEDISFFALCDARELGMTPEV